MRVRRERLVGGVEICHVLRDKCGGGAEATGTRLLVLESRENDRVSGTSLYGLKYVLLFLFGSETKEGRFFLMHSRAVVIHPL